MAESMLRRALLLGIGALSWSRERAEAVVDELVQHGQLDAGEREGMVEAFLERGRRDEESLKAFVAEQVARAVRALSLATRDDLQRAEARLESEIAAMRAELAAMRKAGPGGEG